MPGRNPGGSLQIDRAPPTLRRSLHYEGHWVLKPKEQRVGPRSFWRNVPITVGSDVTMLTVPIINMKLLLSYVPLRTPLVS